MPGLIIAFLLHRHPTTPGAALCSTTITLLILLDDLLCSSKRNKTTIHNLLEMVAATGKNLLEEINHGEFSGIAAEAAPTGEPAATAMPGAWWGWWERL